MNKPTGQQLVDLLQTKVGQKYVFGTLVPKNISTYNGPWDCAEFVSWGVYQLSNQLYGCANDNGKPDSADAYSGYWGRDANNLGNIITINNAARTPGAVLLRLAGHGQVGHVVVSKGNGKTVEAHSTKDGVINNVVEGRRWDFGVLIPWFTYHLEDPVNVTPPAVKIYRLTNPYIVDPVIETIQKALGIHVDGIFGPGTFTAVKSYQAQRGLVADGEVGEKTLKALGLI